jgi:hypothetical protein
MELVKAHLSTDSGLVLYLDELPAGRETAGQRSCISKTTLKKAGELSFGSKRNSLMMLVKSTQASKNCPPAIYWIHFALPRVREKRMNTHRTGDEALR